MQKISVLCLMISNPVLRFNETLIFLADKGNLQQIHKYPGQSWFIFRVINLVDYLNNITYYSMTFCFQIKLRYNTQLYAPDTYQACCKTWSGVWSLFWSGVWSYFLESILESILNSILTIYNNTKQTQTQGVMN